MALIEIPVIWQENASFGLRLAQNVTRLMSGRDVITEFPDADWFYSFTLENLEGDSEELRDWLGALASLCRLSNWFEAGPPGYSGSIYNGAAPLVMGASQVGLALNVDGASVSTVLLRKGEYFSVNGELKIMTSDASTNGSGQATLNFEPPLQAPPADNTALVLTAPKAKFRLVNPEKVSRIKPPVLHSITIECTEAKYAS